jgi:hypothetical protein
MAGSGDDEQIKKLERIMLDRFGKSLRRKQ